MEAVCPSATTAGSSWTATCSGSGVGLGVGVGLGSRWASLSPWPWQWAWRWGVVWPWAKVSAWRAPPTPARRDQSPLPEQPANVASITAMATTPRDHPPCRLDPRWSAAPRTRVACLALNRCPLVAVRIARSESAAPSIIGRTGPRFPGSASAPRVGLPVLRIPAQMRHSTRRSPARTALGPGRGARPSSGFCQFSRYVVAAQDGLIHVAGHAQSAARTVPAPWCRCARRRDRIRPRPTRCPYPIGTNGDRRTGPRSRPTAAGARTRK